jgi:hypothetical protein
MALQGIGRKFPASISASIFSKAAACFPPGEKSCSNSSSQTSLSCCVMNAASLAQLLAAQLRHSFFYFGQAHSERLGLADDMTSTR